MTTPSVATDPSQFQNDDQIRSEADKRLIEKMDQRSGSFISVETGEQVLLSFAAFEQRFVHQQTGKSPDDSDCYNFMNMCVARKLNPFAGDALMIPYVTQGKIRWNLVVAHSALLKRAELSGHFDGMESGVIVIDSDGNPEELPGDFVPSGKELVGGWAKAYRDDRTRPEYDRLNIEVYDGTKLYDGAQRKSRWKIDPAGMIVKCTEASVLRRAFPGETAGMYLREEMDVIDADFTTVTKKLEVEDIVERDDRLIKKSRNKKPSELKPKTVAAKPKTGTAKPKTGAAKPKAKPPERVVAEPENISDEKVEPYGDETVTYLEPETVDRGQTLPPFETLDDDKSDTTDAKYVSLVGAIIDDTKRISKFAAIRKDAIANLPEGSDVAWVTSEIDKMIDTRKQQIGEMYKDETN
jgi:phage recombination protein Bet